MAKVARRTAGSSSTRSTISPCPSRTGTWAGAAATGAAPAGAAGKATEMAVPFPGADSTSMKPPCWTAMP